MMKRHRHLGVYGACRSGEHVLLIRKARGPYKGLLDLPGGEIHFGEEPDAALAREFAEETGLDVGSAAIFRAASNVARYVADDGMLEELHHVGLIYDIALPDQTDGRRPTAKSIPDGEDSAGAVWLHVADLAADRLTPFAYLALLKEPAHCRSGERRAMKKTVPETP